MNNYDLIIGREELVNNPTARVPVCLCLDTSGSMSGARIDELNEGIRMFYESIKEDEMALYSAEISIVTFGKDVKCIENFSTLENQEASPILTAGGLTPMGEGINLALDLLEKRKKEYQEVGVDYYQPWIVVMTDGESNGNPQELEKAISRTVSLLSEKKLIIFPIGIGGEADMNVLKRLSPNRTPLKLKGLNFKEFFAWLSQSVSRTSQSTPGEKIELDVDGIKGWGEL